MLRIAFALAALVALAPSVLADHTSGQRINQAEWEPTGYRQLFEQSDLVVLGTIETVDRDVAGGPMAFDTAWITIEETLSGFTPQARVPLHFPSIHRGRNPQEVQENLKDPTQIRYAEGQGGIFFLKKSLGVYQARHPSRFKPRSFLWRVNQHRP